MPASAVAGSGAGFTGVSSRIEVVGLHYEVTFADLKVRLDTPNREARRMGGRLTCLGDRISFRKPGRSSRVQPSV